MLDDVLVMILFSCRDQVVCEATQSEDSKIAVPSLQCLVRIVSLYYMYMEQYMAAALFGVNRALFYRLRLTYFLDHD